MPRPKGSADLLEDRRKRALALLDAGHSLNEVGRRVGCNPSSVMRWRDARRRGGPKALRVRFSPGRPWKRALEQDEGKIKRWKQRDWPRVKTTLRGWVPISYLPTNPGSF